MTAAQRAVDHATRWVAWYTRRLPKRDAKARRVELASDLWEQRTAGAGEGRDERAMTRAIYRRVLAGAPNDLNWRAAQQVAGERRRTEQRAMREEATMVTHGTDDGWVRLRLTTRRCKVCNERYARRNRYCPVCKTRKGSNGQPAMRVTNPG